MVNVGDLVVSLPIIAMISLKKKQVLMIKITFLNMFFINIFFGNKMSLSYQ